MSAKQYVRCRACGWRSSRAKRADGLYGICSRCGHGTLYEPRPRRLLASHRPTQGQPILTDSDRLSSTLTGEPRYASQWATWPELVAAAMQAGSTRKHSGEV